MQDPCTLFDENINLAYWFARRYEHEMRLIELDDLAQESLKALWYASRAYKEEKGPFGTFAAVVITRALNRYIGKSYRHQMITLSKCKYTEPFREIKSNEYLSEELDEALDTLSYHQRMCLLHKYLGGSYTKLAKHLGVSKQAIVDTSMRAIRKLRRAYLCH